MKTFKVLWHNPLTCQYISPVAGTPWRNNSMHAQPGSKHGVYSCETPINPQLIAYIKDIKTRIVALEVWGNIEIYDNGVVVSEHAEIIGEVSPEEMLAWIITNPSPHWIRALSILYPEFTPPETSRELICKTPEIAIMWATFIDRSPHDFTRRVACQSPSTACQYAEEVDRCPRDDTRAAACGDPRVAYWYAVTVDRCPRDDTRAAACGDPWAAYMYACFVDRCPRHDTRTAACRDVWDAYDYARDVDRAPHPDTRAAACRESMHAYQYARDIDQCYHPDTWEAVRNSHYAKLYKKYLLSLW